MNDDEYMSKEEVIVHNIGVLTVATFLCISVLLFSWIAGETNEFFGWVLFSISCLAFVYYADTRIWEGAALLILSILLILLFIVDTFFVNLPFFDTIINAIF
jgi:hypothetical protein